MDETARAIGNLEATVATLVKSVEDLVGEVSDLRSQSIETKARERHERRTWLVASNMATGVVSFIGSQFGGQIVALLPWLPHPR